MPDDEEEHESVLGSGDEEDPIADLLIGMDAKLDHIGARLELQTMEHETKNGNGNGDIQRSSEPGATAGIEAGTTSGQQEPTQAGGEPESNTIPATSTDIQAGTTDGTDEQQSEREPDRRPSTLHWYFKPRWGNRR